MKILTFKEFQITVLCMYSLTLELGKFYKVLDFVFIS